MWTMTRNTTISLLLALFFWCWPGAIGYCQTYTVTGEELATLENHLDALEQNNSELLTILNESNEDLTTAKEALTASKQELTALKQRLQTLMSEAEQARRSLETANEELQKAAQSLKQSEAAHGKTEGRIRTQRNIWEALFFVACGVAATR